MVSNTRLLLGRAPSHSAKHAAWKARPQRAAGHVTLGAAPAHMTVHRTCKSIHHPCSFATLHWQSQKPYLAATGNLLVVH